jgi:stress response protein YsnF
MPPLQAWFRKNAVGARKRPRPSGIITTFVLRLVITFSRSHEDNMTTIRQLLQNSPAKANELFARLADTSDTAVKTRERLFTDLKAELELLATLEEEHLFPVLRRHKETKGLVAEALNDNKQTRKLIAELERIPKESEEFARKVAELRKVHRQSVRDEKNELLPAILKALSDEEAQAIVERIEGEKAEIEEARRAEAEQRRAEARSEREHDQKVLAEQQEAAERAQETRKAARQTVDAAVRTGEVAAESATQIVRSTAEGVGRLATAPLSSGSLFWDAMFGMWTAPLGRSVGRPTNAQPSAQAEEVIPLAEETLIVGKRTVTSGTTTVRRFIVETPVEQRVSLYDEKVVVERRKPVTDTATGETLTEVTIEMIETSEVPVVGKEVKVREEVVVRRERTSRVETVRDTVRRDEIEIKRSDANERSDKKRPALAYSRK